MQRILITGANRGIGLEFTRQYLERGDRIFAACRNPDAAAELHALADAYPDRLSIIQMEVTDDASIVAAADAVRRETKALDLLINNAGIISHGERIDNLSRETLMRLFDVNAVSPMIVTQHFINLVAKGRSPKIINITSGAGSLENKDEGTFYSYGASKSALNMFSKTLANELRSRRIVVVALHPGWVQTDMGGRGAHLKPERAIRSMIQLIDGLKKNDTGRYLQWDGRDLPW
ncbi:MAG: SDR family oxidoreductase [Anaerolineae bacterium]|nr:SDR family oxidoreductase [Anaerolineae bacterium]